MLKWAQFFAIWYYLYTFKKVKNAHGGVLLLVKLMPVTLPKVKFLHECFSRFLNCKCYQIAQSVSIGSHHEKAYVTNPLNKRKERANFCRFLCNASKILRFLFSIAPGSIARALVFSVFFFFWGVVQKGSGLRNIFSWYYEMVLKKELT